MSLMIDILEGMLDLTDEEKAQIAPCLPAAQDAVDALNAAWPDVDTLNTMITTTQTLRNQAMGDLDKLMPDLAALLDDGMVDCGSSIQAIKDMQGIVKNNPMVVHQLGTIYTKMVPVINKVQADWPQIEPAIKIIIAACQRKGWSLSTFLGGLHGALRAQPPSSAARTTP
jgi:hypothetical protein